MAVSQTAPRAPLIRSLSLALALLAAFWIVTIHLTQDSLWFDEGYSLYVVRDTEALSSDRPAAVARHVVNSLRDALARARADVHPPLYFLLLDAWTLAAGESVFTVRLLSTFSGLIGLAATYTLGKRLFNHRTGLVAMLLLATAGMFVYYSRETRMYTLLLALTTLATLAYLRWQERPTLWRTLAYGGLAAALVYTHYAGVLIALTHALHLLLTQPRRIWRIFLPGMIATLLVAPWLPALYWQLTTHGGAAAIPFDDLHTAMAALIFFLTGGTWGLFALPVVVAFMTSPPSPLSIAMERGSRAKRDGGEVNRADTSSTVLLLLLWLIVTPLVLVLFNGTVRALFQVRYTIAILPAGALLVVYGIAGIRTRHVVPLQWHRVITIGAIIYVALLVYTNLTLYPFVWPAKPDWESAIQRMAVARQTLEPAITLIPETTPAAYYARQFPVRRGISLDLSWRWQESYDMTNMVAHMGSAESVWLVMPSTHASTWDAARELLATRMVGYRDSVMNMLFYRFDAGAGTDLQFTFADRLAYRGGIRNSLYAVPGEDFCFTVAFEALVDFEHEYAADVYLTQGYGTIRAITTQRIGQPAAGENLTLETCLPIAADNPAGPHHLRMRVYDTMNHQTLPLLEQGEMYWGDELIFALVSVG